MHSPGHAEHRAVGSAAFRTIEIDQDGNALTFRVTALFERMHSFEYLRAFGVTGDDSGTSTHSNERARRQLRIKNRHFRIAGNPLNQIALRIAHPQPELIVAGRVEAAYGETCGSPSRST